ncbi:MAG TPA: PhoPQ-activated pathogenicity-like protein PqaA type, partial [Bacteroides sp.]|nr:PhoPQ-activated pathogenicity-like protein PqaA type [Bacteroides sp.]
QPLYGDLTEDALISYTLQNFREDGDYTWPLLFPMVKAASRAMDAVQEFSSEQLDHQLTSFIVAGASKRGWTTWLTASQDERVGAIAPMVIDVLNMPVNLDYQVKVWGDYSVQIQDYVDLGIPQSVHTETGQAIATMIDPYSYRASLTMPKMIIIGTNDEYWPVDAVKHYLDDIPGENFLHYVPNAGHDLGDKEQALRALSAFFGRSLSGGPYPECNWNVTPTGTGVLLSVEATAEELLDAFLWTADSEDRDFRDETFVSSDLNGNPGSEVQFPVDFPGSGYRAFYVDLVYPDPNGGEYSKSTRMFVADTEQILED